MSNNHEDSVVSAVPGVTAFLSLVLEFFAKPVVFDTAILKIDTINAVTLFKLKVMNNNYLILSNDNIKSIIID